MNLYRRASYRSSSLAHWFLTAVAFVFIGILFVGTSDPAGAQKAILDMGDFENIQIDGWSLFGCGNGDFYKTEFRATRSDRSVSGIVCRGLFFKGSTVRIY